MLRDIDLKKKMEKTDFKSRTHAVELRLGELQRAAREQGIPVIIVFEGFDAAGKGTAINRLMQALDPRGYTVHPTNAPTQEEQLRPFLWRFWTKTPGKGKFAIFDRSWYGRVLVERLDKKASKKQWKQAYADIRSFETHLASEGCVIVKFFLAITKREQKKRFKNLASNPATSWKVTKEDWARHRHYDAYMTAAEEAVTQTDTALAPWTIVEAHDWRFASAKVGTAVIEALERRLERSEKPSPRKARKATEIKAAADLESSILDRADLTLSLDEKEYAAKLKSCQKRLNDLEHEAYKRRLPVILAFEGWDAAGKGGVIRRLAAGLDPRGYEVIPVAAPNEVEKAHSYLWRFWERVPKAGHFAIFDRSWYGRVLVERVEGFCPEADWRRAYHEINDMEGQWAASGAVVEKFWLHISKEEQLARFKARQALKDKQWKITDEDWRNREKWDRYKAAVDEMLYRTGTAEAPWTVVEANCKRFARTKILRTVIDAIEKKL